MKKQERKPKEIKMNDPEVYYSNNEVQRERERT